MKTITFYAGRSVFIILVILILLNSNSYTKCSENIKKRNNISSQVILKRKPVKIKKGVRKKFIDMFLKSVETKNLPQRDTVYITKKYAKLKKLNAEIDKITEEIKKIEEPYKQKILKTYGLTNEEIEKMSKQKESILNQFKEASNEAYQEYLSLQEARIPIDQYPEEYGTTQTIFSLYECKEITVRVCEEKICVDQPLPMIVNTIRTYNNASGKLSIMDDNNTKFSLSDGVNTPSNGTAVHAGEIEIRCSCELVEPTVVNQIGFEFFSLVDDNGDPRSNGNCVHGEKQCFLFFCDESWGKVWMTYWYEIYVIEPSEDELRLYRKGERYVNTGKINSNISCWNYNVLGSSLYKHLFLDMSDLNWVFPEGTQFLLEIHLEYEIKAGGDIKGTGSASVDYNLEVKPYINIQACTYEFPETIEINVSNLINAEE